MQHGYDIHSTFVVCRLRLPSYQQAQNAGKAKIVERLYIFRINLSHSVYHVDYFLNIGLINKFVALQNLLFFLLCYSLRNLVYATFFH